MLPVEELGMDTDYIQICFGMLRSNKISKANVINTPCNELLHYIIQTFK